MKINRYTLRHYLAVFACSISLSILMVLAAAPVNASTETGTTTLDVNLASKHLDDCWGAVCENEYNEVNLGLGLSHRTADNLEFNAGFVNNSFNILSFYFGATVDYPKQINQSYSIVPGVFLGGTTGYENTPVTDDKVTFVVAPSLSVDFGRFRAQTLFIPARNTPSFAFRVGFSF